MVKSCLFYLDSPSKLSFKRPPGWLECRSQALRSSEVAHRQWVPTLGHLWSRKQKLWRPGVDKLSQGLKVSEWQQDRGRATGESKGGEIKKIAMWANWNPLSTTHRPSHTHTHTHTHTQLLLVLYLILFYFFKNPDKYLFPFERF